MSSSSTRIFGEQLSKNRENVGGNSKSKFSLKTEVSKLAGPHVTYPKGTKMETINFANSIEAKLFSEAEDIDGFIEQIIKLEQLDMNGVMSADSGPETQSDIVYDWNYFVVYFAAVGAVFFIPIDVTRSGPEEQKYILNEKSKPFITTLLAAAKQAGGILFTEKVAKAFSVKMLDAFHKGSKV